MSGAARVVRIRPRAHVDAVDHYLYIQADNPAAAERFLDALATAYGALADHPQMGRAYPSGRARLQALRMYRLPNPFRNYAVYYAVGADTIEVVRVLHGAMNITPDFF